MTQNMGPIDRAARVVVAFAVALLSLSLGFGTVIGIVLLVVAGISSSPRRLASAPCTRSSTSARGHGAMPASDTAAHPSSWTTP
jgi:hypothetical protein